MWLNFLPVALVDPEKLAFDKRRVGPGRAGSRTASRLTMFVNRTLYASLRS